MYIGEEQMQMQMQIHLDLYEATTTCEVFSDTFLWFEKYLEITASTDGHGFQKQIINDEITRPDIGSFDPKRAQAELLTQLNIFKITTKNKPKDFLEKLETVFYKWLDGSGINVTNCSDELAHDLIATCKILKDERNISLLIEHTKKTREYVEKMNEEEFSQNLNNILSAYKGPLENEDKKEESLRNKHYTDDVIERGFNFLKGDEEKGKAIFDDIVKNHYNKQTTNMYLSFLLFN
ncbi:hypothetical protein C1645_818448 [Glomus cerebriforme]|uniref:Uncharacterized protein n=1 Tax=Glomus cerebriforme TaxID=658196 RepID=A0A397TH13_9GLOM|nr:hypothetical protein C1645_818448 [Glomus cerebriforme]